MLTGLSESNISCLQIQGTLLTLLQMEEAPSTDEFPGFEHLSIRATRKVAAMTGDICPFANSISNPCHSGRNTYSVKNKMTNEEFKISELGIGMLSHGICEQGAERVTPEKMCEILEIQPADLITEMTVLYHVSTSGIEESDVDGDEEIAKRYSKETRQLDQDTTVYVLPFKSYDDIRQLEQEPPSKKIKRAPEGEKLYYHIFNRLDPDLEIFEPRSWEDLFKISEVSSFSRVVILDVFGSRTKVRLTSFPSVSIYECKGGIRVIRNRQLV